MVTDMLSRVKAIDLDILTEVVRKDQRSPLFEITEWSVRLLSNQGVINPEGLWLYSGLGRDLAGPRAWRVVLKFLIRPAEEAPLDNMWYWKREVHLAQSGYPNALPEGLAAPRFYRIDEAADGVWLWLEYIENQRPDPWGIDDYAFAARQLGKWNGAVAAAGSSSDEPWFLSSHSYRYWYNEANPEKDFEFPLNQKYISGELRLRYDRLWMNRQLFYDVLETLPKFFTHGDSQRRNLMIRKSQNGQDELALIDWAMCGLLPLGAELNYLVEMSTVMFGSPPEKLTELDAAVFDSYLQGLHQAGWSGDADLVRLGHKAWTAVWLGVTFPNIFAMWCTPEFRAYATQWFGLTDEELYLGWLPVFTYALDCAEEAERIMEKLSLAGLG